MRIINLDYKKLNSDTSQVISEFTDIVANVGLEFKLAKLTLMENAQRELPEHIRNSPIVQEKT